MSKYPNCSTIKVITKYEFQSDALLQSRRGIIGNPVDGISRDIRCGPCFDGLACASCPLVHRGFHLTDGLFLQEEHHESQVAALRAQSSLLTIRSFPI